MADGDGGTNLIMQTLLQLQKDIGENTAVCAGIRDNIAEHVRKDEIVHAALLVRLTSLEESRSKQRGAARVLAILWTALTAVGGVLLGIHWHK
jgi:hypothetical protein